MVTVLCETSHAAARCRQFARLGDPVSRPVAVVKPAGTSTVLHTWHDCKLKGVHGRACHRKRWLFYNPEGQHDQQSQVLPRAPFFDAVPTSVITEALRGHPRREHFVVIHGGVLKYAGQRRIGTYLNLCLSLEEVLAC